MGDSTTCITMCGGPVYAGFFKRLSHIRNTEKSEPQKQSTGISPRLEDNIAAMRELFRNDSDFVIREFVIPAAAKKKAALFCIDGLVSIESIKEGVLGPLMIESRKMQDYKKTKLNSIADIVNFFLVSPEIKTSDSLEAGCEACLIGDTVLMVDGFAELVCFNTKGFEKRSVSEPQTETVVRGPREGFTEVLRVNTSLIRRKIKNSSLRMDTMTIGTRTNTLVCLTYIDDIANPELIREVKRRLGTINTDAILNSGYIDELIEDSTYSIFQTINYSEKPDIVAARLLEGRCALVVDGSPFVLTMPMLFIECFQSPEDYAVRSYYATFLRIMRLIAFFVSLVAPAVYVALTTFHQELIPTPLLFTIAASSEGLPFPSTAETAIMLITFEILKEAGIRLPKPVGQAISIVGALVMGQAAIQAGIVGAPVVIVIAITAVSSFVSPVVSDSTAILRWYLLLLTSIMGGFGIAIGLLTILIHLASLESFGSVYLHPFLPLYAADLKDSIVRVPLWEMRTRPEELHATDKARQDMSKPEFGKGDE